MRAAVLAIGTELTTGQITNKNATWISRQLAALGVEVTTHLTVPDDRALILQSLHGLADLEFIFITGGLGPTSDDFTRDMVSEFAQAKMEFDPESWEMLSERLLSRGYSVKEIQRQQCFFPVGSHILKNKHGTANGFWLQVKGTDIFVLPGPPNEVEACWHAGVSERLKEKTQSIDPLVTYHWDTMGLGESDLAMLVSEVTDQLPNRNELDLGFRVHLPYVEFKITAKKSKIAQYEDSFEKLNQHLKPYLVSTDGLDLAEKLFRLLKKYPRLSVVDDASHGFLMQRLSPFFKELKSLQAWSFSSWQNSSDVSELELGLLIRGENRAEIYLRKKKQVLKIEVSTPYSKPLMAERSKQYFSELAIIQWGKWLS